MPNRKRGAMKPTKKTSKSLAPRKRKASPGLNRRRLQEDIDYYEERKFDDKRRTPPSERHKQGIQLRSLRYDSRSDTYVTQDGTVRITPEEYNRIGANPRAVPQYTPIKDNNGKITGFYNVQTKHTVTPYYRYQIFGKHFRNVDTEEDVERANLYQSSLELQRSNRLQRHHDLIESYSLRNPQFREANPTGWRTKIANDRTFRSLVSELQSYHYKQYGITPENVAIADEALGGTYNEATVETEVELLKEQLGEDPRYQEVLVLLGRRLPSEDRPVGSYGPGYIKSEVVPYYQSMFDSVEFEE
jgi:hypothetical protein